MDDDSEQALLMGNQHKSNTMRYTDGPSVAAPLRPDADATPTSYENDVPCGGSCYDNNPGKKNPSGSLTDQSQSSDILSDIMTKAGATLRQQFHADALKQIGFGRYQIITICISGLALATQIAQLFSLYFIIPSIDLEFCMTPKQKKTLIVSNLVGASFGAIFTSGFAEIFGRKRTLLSCFICMIIFSVVAAFMPVFKAFGAARMIASAFGAGTFPIAATYICETTPANMRGRAIGFVTSFGGVGAFLAAVISWSILPKSGVQLLQEPEEHFSGWHTYSLLMATPSIIVILGLLVLKESPRFLLSKGKEAEALKIYQTMYRLNNSSGTYSFIEMSIPRMKPRNKYVSQDDTTGISGCLMEFFCCFRSPFWRTNSIIAIIWIIAMFVGYGLPVYAFNNGHNIESHLFLEQTNFTLNKTFEIVEFSENIVNQIFKSCHFLNCTFNQKLLNYVEFENCTFFDSNFHGVTAAYTTFWYSIFNNVKFIDTNLKSKNFIGCEKINTEFDQIEIECDEPFELYTFFYKVMHDANVEVIIPSIIILFWGGEILNRIGRIRFATCCIILAAVVCFLIEFVSDGAYMYWTVGVVQASIFCGLQALTLYSIEFNYTIGRCLICGIQVSCGYWGAFLGADVYDQLLPDDNARFIAISSVLCLFALCFFSTFLKENKKFL